MIAIKGMEIPKSCSQCKLCVEDKYADMTCVLLCDEWEESDYNENHRDERCPLVEIVTCKNCKHNYENTCDLDGYGINDDYFVQMGKGRIMTYEDIYNEFCNKFPNADVKDYRPAVPMHIPQLSVGIPYAIIVWLKDGSKVVYIAERKEQ